jgi:hypothetical protein
MTRTHDVNLPAVCGILRFRMEWSSSISPNSIVSLSSMEKIAIGEELPWSPAGSILLKTN